MKRLPIETIFTKIESAVKNANIKGIVFEKGYPRDIVRHKKSNDEILDDEGYDTLTPLVAAMKVIMGVVEKEATCEDDVVVSFRHNPFEEEWCIEIGDGR